MNKKGVKMETFLLVVTFGAIWLIILSIMLVFSGFHRQYEKPVEKDGWIYDFLTKKQTCYWVITESGYYDYTDIEGKELKGVYHRKGDIIGLMKIPTKK